MDFHALQQHGLSYKRKKPQKEKGIPYSLGNALFLFAVYRNPIYLSILLAKLGRHLTFLPLPVHIGLEGNLYLCASLIILDDFFQVFHGTHLTGVEPCHDVALVDACLGGCAVLLD